MADYASKSQQARLAESARIPGRGGNPELATTRTSWVGWIVFAAVMMILMGSFHAIQGLVALFKDDYYAVGSSGLVLSVSYTAWGWVHLVGGAVAVAGGLALLAGKMWARVLGTVIACVSAIVNLGFLSAYPIWSTLMIGMDILIVMALTVHGGEMTDRE